MKILIFVFVILGILNSCDQNKLSRKKIQHQWVESKFLNDTIFNGETLFYNDSLKIEKIEHYTNGIKDGASVNFHSNGKVYDSVTFSNGFKNGFHYVYDSSGNLGYIDYYYLGRELGPSIFYTKGLVTDYSFHSFEKQEIYRTTLDSAGNKIHSAGDLYNSIPYTTFVEGELVNNVFSYFVRPPKMSIIYELVTKDTSTGKELTLRTFNNQIFIDTIVSKNSNTLKHFIKASVFDSSIGKMRIYYDELVYSKQ
jgi:hypothetical protein